MIRCYPVSSRFLIGGQLIKMHVVQVDIAQEAILALPGLVALSRGCHNLLEPLLDLLKIGMEVRCTTLLERQLDFDRRLRCRDIAARNWLKDSLPSIRSKPRYCEVGIVKIEQRCGEGFQFFRGLLWKVYYLVACQNGQVGMAAIFLLFDSSDRLCQNCNGWPKDCSRDNWTPW